MVGGLRTISNQSKGDQSVKQDIGGWDGCDSAQSSNQMVHQTESIIHMERVIIGWRCWASIEVVDGSKTSTDIRERHGHVLLENSVVEFRRLQQ